jgi:capsular polysaccharide biosynthesis protein
MNDRPVDSRGEIELIEILKVIWKWKYLILVGTLVFAVLAGAISLTRPKIYRVTMVLQPAVVGMDRWGRKIQVDSAANMEALIEAGTFNNAIRNHLKSLKIGNRPDPLKFIASSSRGSDIIRVSYETSFPERGITIMNLLPSLLRKEYADVIKHVERDFKEKIKTESEKLLDLETQKGIAITAIKNLQERLTELNQEIKVLESNNNLLIKKHKNLIDDHNMTQINANLLYADAIQENLRTINEYKNQLLALRSRKEKTEIDLKMIKEKIDVSTKEIADLKNEKDNLQYIQLLQSPTRSSRPIKPKPKVAVVVGCVVGLFIMVIMTFFIEYISQHRSKNKS